MTQIKKLYDWLNYMHNEHVCYTEYDQGYKGCMIDIMKKIKEIESQAIPELSDEEIEKQSKKNYGAKLTAFIEGAKWYREQLKQRQ